MPEVILSFGFFAIAILTLIGLSLSISRTDSKAMETAAGTLIADQVLGRTLASLRSDTPPGSRAGFFSGEYVDPPWDSGSLVNGKTTFYYELTTNQVEDVATGGPLGDPALSNRLIKLNIRVWWASEEQEVRQGSGRLQVTTSRLVSEAEILDDPSP
ncbi:MAG: hypothetical protein KC800_10240 [Candidatus Eremiobacteraeota bacterium]|nr:hypothetical protein [Candidatus Eremiobacteraeota bacterium]